MRNIPKRIESYLSSVEDVESFEINSNENAGHITIHIQMKDELKDKKHLCITSTQAAILLTKYLYLRTPDSNKTIVLNNSELCTVEKGIATPIDLDAARKIKILVPTQEQERGKLSNFAIMRNALICSQNK